MKYDPESPTYDPDLFAGDEAASQAVDNLRKRLLEQALAIIDGGAE